MKLSLKRGDAILIICFLFISLVGIVFILSIKSDREPQMIKISSEGKFFELPLRDTLFQVQGPLGVTDVRINKGHVYVTKAPCPNKLCMKQGKISRNGESIICIPNKIIITIEGNRKTDATTY
ncbi:hypothetical protein GX441_08050 [bacterium]|nr:hypothetical protein [bacterium]